MSRRYRLPSTPIGVGVAVALVLLMAGLVNRQNEGVGPFTPPAKEQKEAGRAGTPSVAVAKPSPERDEQRAEDDLEAQQEMAKWAFWMFVASALGVVLIGATLRETWKAGRAAGDILSETKRQADIAERVGFAQVRAYLAIIDATIQIEPVTFFPKATLVIRNTGNSPARQLNIAYRGAVATQIAGQLSARVQDKFPATAGPEFGMGFDFAAGETRALNHIFSDFPLTEPEREAVGKGAITTFEAIVRLTFVDVFDTVIADEHVRLGPIEAIGEPKPFFKIPFSIHLGWMPGFKATKQGTGT